MILIILINKLFIFDFYIKFIIYYIMIIDFLLLYKIKY